MQDWEKASSGKKSSVNEFALFVTELLLIIGEVWYGRFVQSLDAPSGHAYVLAKHPYTENKHI